MANTGAGSDGQHNAISSWFWWCYPANGGGTGGIVVSDWLTIDWNKVRVLTAKLRTMISIVTADHVSSIASVQIDYLTRIGLKPWYLR